MTVYYVLSFDNEDPSWSDVEYLSVDRDKCVDYIKEHWEDYYSGEYDDDEYDDEYEDDYDDEYEEAEEEVDADEDDSSDSESTVGVPLFIENFDEREIENELHLIIKDTELDLNSDPDSINYQEGYSKAKEEWYEKGLEEGNKIGREAAEKEISKSKKVEETKVEPPKEDCLSKEERDKYILTKNCLGAIKVLIAKAGL